MADPYQPSTSVEEALLLSERFDPAVGPGVYLHAETIAYDFAASVEEIEDALRRFEAAGLVKGGVRPGLEGRAYQAQANGHEARERYLRLRSLRHPALARQREHLATDLVLALANCPYVWNTRSAGFLCGEPQMTLRELQLYLSDFPPDEVGNACAELVRRELLRPLKTNGSNEPAFQITGRGRQEYRTTSGRLGIAGGETILDVQVKTSIDVFNAWQSEHPPARNAIGAALKSVVAEINGISGLSHPLRVVQATEAGEGAIRIDVALQEKIKKADLFVGDLTAVYAYGERLRVNENVLVEVGYALASKEPNQIVLVAMKRDDVPGEASKAKLTFDISHVRRHEFRAKGDLQKWLRNELEVVLRCHGWLQ